MVIMLEIRIHGRGGQGAVTMATLLAKAAGYDGKYAQAFPSFGPERRGAPIKAFCRISREPITVRSHVYTPDYVVVLDPTLLGLPQVSEGLKEKTVIIVNSKEEVNMSGPNRVLSIDASSLAMNILGRNIVNTAMLGVFAKALAMVKLDSVKKAIREVFGKKGKVADLNVKLVQEVFDKTEV